MNEMESAKMRKDESECFSERTYPTGLTSKECKT